MSLSMKAVSLIEKDVNNDLIAWAFPAVDADTEATLKARCGLQAGSAGEESAFRFSRFGQNWQYIIISPVERKDNTEKVVAVAIVVLSDEFNPAKYNDMLKIFAELYLAERTPIPIMKAYLTIFTRGALKTKLGAFQNSDYDNRKALVSSVKDIFAIYGLESVVIWVAMLLKKRVFVFSDKVSDLMSIVRSFPLMGCWHRQNWSLLRPYMTLADKEMEELKALGIYVAGFTDPGCQARIKDYDLFIDLSARSFTISDHAQGDFTMTKFHKQAAEAFLQACEEGNDQAVIKAIALKTNELITNTKSLAVEHEDGTYITLDELNERKLPAGMAGFLYNVALAEGLTKL